MGELDDSSIAKESLKGTNYTNLLGMGDNKNFMSRYIITVIITIIDIITISLNSATCTKIVEIS